MGVLYARVSGAWVPISASPTTTTAWIAPTLINGWVNFGGGYNNAAYRMVGDMVQLRGLIKSGTLGGSSPCFTLPVGYRPAAQHILACGSNDAFGEIRIPTDGSVLCIIGNVAWFCLDNLSFSVTA